jgi:hypothetical protein
MRRLLSVAIVAILSVAACQTAAPAVDQASLLYSQTAAGGRLEPAAGDGAYTLVLTGVDGHTIQFSDRPTRSATVIALADFVAHWAALFGDDPPNAALVEHDRAGDADTVVVTVSRPIYDRASDELRFDAHLLADEHAPGRLAGVIHRTHSQPPASFGAASLFIDDATGTVINGCLVQPYTHCNGLDLAGVDLSGSDLTGADLDSVNLSGANLSAADLTSATLIRANLSAADLSGATLWGAYPGQANLRNANLSDADLSYAYLPDTDLTGANLTGANLSNVCYRNTIMPDGSINNDSSNC